MPVPIKALLIAASQTSLVPDPAVIEYQFPQVEQVICRADGWIYYGTAFKAGGYIVSVAHVTKGRACAIGDQWITSHQEGDRDFSLIDGAAVGYKVDCGGFKAGEHYYAVGYAHGYPQQRVIHLYGTGLHHGTGLALLLGEETVIPGMSGGPILNLRGEVVGTVNSYWSKHGLSGSVELRKTAVCQNVPS